MSTSGSDATPGAALQYSYMFETNNAPTKQLDALLRAIARHIILEIGDRQDAQLTPTKLAAFYKAVGGDYDSLFIDMTHPSIAYVWQRRLRTPSIPALTFRGFSRWESLEILLGPEEHVPFLQYAVKNWALKHPDTGEDFPPELPATVFPTQPNVEVDRWHKSCADRLKSEAASSAEEGTTPKPSPAAEQPPPRFTYVHVNPFQPTSSPRPRATENDYFGRPMSYTHVPMGRHASTRRSDRSPRREETAEDRARRKSFSDYTSEPLHPDMPPHAYSSTYLDPGFKRPTEQPRRHSHPRHQSSESSDGEPMPEPINHKVKRRRHPVSPPPPPSVRRFVPPSAPIPPPAASGVRPHRSDTRSDDPKRRSVPSPLGSLRSKLSETVSSILPNGFTSDRPRAGSRQNSSNDPIRVRRSREQFQPSRLSRSYSDPDSDDSSELGPTDDVRRRRRARDERERERYQRGRVRDSDRDWDDERDRDSGGRRERPYLRRPETQRRTSSHADIDRQRDQPGWDPRDREHRRKWERRSPDESTVPPTTGVSGRRYAEAAYS
ncbi:hypothetical protein ACCO45_006633 [Purpureocillium lilacinum]|uniref:Uncharacterized protein n=1 Tax=Purpureocillium lilacinum TaxID=33203 RepID=A0ACC4DQ09_PURLI